MFVLIENEVEEFEPNVSCSMLGSFPTFDDAHKEMLEVMKSYVENGDPCDGLWTEDYDDEGYVWTDNNYCRCSWHIFEVKEG